ncbi:MAG TPA: LuxR C-terminal-related transcriptional regulator [Gemmatimonadaceae bacterium]
MVHAPPPTRRDDDRQPHLLTDEQGRRYALVPLGGYDLHDLHEARELREAREAREAREVRVVREAHDAGDPRDARDARDAHPASHHAPAPAPAPAIAAWRLTPREVDVARHVARGLPNKRIALECGMREGTVKSHIHRLFHKLDVASRVELVLRLREDGDDRGTATASSFRGNGATGEAAHRR